MIKQFHLICTAFMFFTRIPLPFKVPYSKELMNRSSRYYSLIGLLIGSLAFLYYYLASFLFNHEIALWFSIIGSVLTTGSFHEDGLADSLDALGGGYEKTRILEIMKDSRIGTFGSMALILMIFLKFLSLKELSPTLLLGSFLFAHSFSRSISTLLIFFSQYVTLEGSKSKPLASEMKLSDFLVNFVISLGVGAYFFYSKPLVLLAIILFQIILFISLKKYLEKKIGGFTGDLLGATQQLSEVTIYLIIGSKLWTSI